MTNISSEAEELYKSGKKEEAVIKLAKSLESNFKQLNLILQLSTYLTYGGEFDQAEELLLKSKNFFPDDELINYNLGNVYYSKGEFDKAAAIFKNVKSAEGFYMLGLSYQKLGNSNLALVYAITAADKGEESVYYESVGDILLSLGKIKESKDYYYKSVEIELNERNAFNLALSLTVLGDETEAKKYFNISKKINSKYYEENIQRLEDIQKLINGKNNI